VLLTLSEILALVGVGLLAGALGGLFGIGGSLLIIPALAIVFGPNQHLYQAAAMIVNIFVAAPAAIRHWKYGAVQWPILKKLLPFAIIFIIVGVLASDQVDGKALQQMFGVFLLYVIFMNLVKVFSRNGEDRELPLVTWPRTTAVGSIMGFFAGLLGIGGGVILVPLLQRICRLPLRQCIATSTALMCLSSIFGAFMKNASLSQHADFRDPERMLSYMDSVSLAMYLLPTAIIGGYIGATLTHTLPLKWVRVAFVLLLLWASGQMLGLL
jgi:uncharacterized membrane protein YfcA